MKGKKKMAEGENEERSLIDEAIRQGAQLMDNPEFDDFPSFGKIVGDGKIHFYDDLPRMDFKELLGKRIIVHAVRIVRNWESEFGPRSFALIMVETPDRKKYTTISSGKGIFNQCQNLDYMSKQRKVFPMAANIVMKPTEDGQFEYYSFA